MAPPTFVSLFAGIGGFDLALERAGWKCIGQVEINEDCLTVLGAHWPDVPRHTDITTVKAEDLVDADGRGPDLLCGGFPCQDLSVAGKRAGLEGERSGLFYEYARLIEEVSPTWVVIENVPGLLSSDGGRDMGIVLGTLGDLGYGYSYRVLDAQFYGVAQRRRRVFVVGCLGDRAGSAAVLLEPAGSTGDSPPRREKRAGVAPDAEGSAVGRSRESRLGELANALSGVGGPRGTTNNPQFNDHTVVATQFTGNDFSSGDEYSPPLRAGADRQNTVPVIPEVAGCLQECDAKGPDSDTKPGHLIPYRKATRPHAAGEPERWEETDVMHTLTTELATSPPSDAVVQAMVVRRLTPTECERLQGFPDGHTAVLRHKPTKQEPNRMKPMPDSVRYRMLGNAVAVPVVQWIAKRMRLAHLKLERRSVESAA